LCTVVGFVPVLAFSWRVAVALIAVFCVIGPVSLAYGLRKRRRWAHMLGTVLYGGVFLCMVCFILLAAVLPSYRASVLGDGVALGILVYILWAYEAIGFGLCPSILFLTAGKQ